MDKNLPIDFSAMTDVGHESTSIPIINKIEDPIISDSDAIMFATVKALALDGSRILGQTYKDFPNPAFDVLRKFF